MLESKTVTVTQRETDKFIITVDDFNILLQLINQKDLDMENLNNAIKLELMRIHGILLPKTGEFCACGICIKADHY